MVSFIALISNRFLGAARIEDRTSTEERKRQDKLCGELAASPHLSSTSQMSVGEINYHLISQ